MSYNEELHDPEPFRRFAPRCDDQLPIFSTVGRGLTGNEFEVNVIDNVMKKAIEDANFVLKDLCCDTRLEGITIDPNTGERHTKWTSTNINGGQLWCQYNLRPWTNPQTFTITWIYRRTDRDCEWSWTTPAIPYLYDADGDGRPDVDKVIGSGVGDLYVKTMHTSWNERLHFPKGTTATDYNAPAPLAAWSATITFGYGGDVEVPDFDDIAKILGITKTQLFNILSDKSVTINGITASNIIDYIDKCDKRDLDHIHADMGFNSTGHGSNTFGGYATVKAYIDAKDAELLAKISSLQTEVNNLNTKINNIKNGIANIIYGATVDDSGNITIPSGTKVPTGNINIYSGGTSAYIKTRNGEVNNDIRAD